MPEAARRLGVTRQAVHQLAQRGRIRAKLQPGPLGSESQGTWLVDPASVEEWKNKSAPEGAPTTD